MFVFVVAFQASNISAIILSSQTMDTTLVAMFKKSFALQIYPAFGGTSTADGVRCTLDSIHFCDTLTRCKAIRPLEIHTSFPLDLSSFCASLFPWATSI